MWFVHACFCCVLFMPRLISRDARRPFGEVVHSLLFQYPIKTRLELRDFYFYTTRPIFASPQRDDWDCRSTHNQEWFQLVFQGTAEPPNEPGGPRFAGQARFLELGFRFRYCRP